MSRSRSRSAASSASKKSRSLSSSLSRSRSRSRSSEMDGYRLHIADIGDDMRKIDLERCFAPYGELKEVWMTNSRPCFGFAVFKNKSDAAVAVKECDGMEVNGSRIRVSYARPRTRGLGKRNYYSNNMRCYQCGASGHFYRDCPEVGSRGGGGRYRGGGGGAADRDTDRFGRERRRSERGDRGDRESRRDGRKHSRRDSGEYGRSSRREERSGRRTRY